MAFICWWCLSWQPVQACLPHDAEISRKSSEWSLCSVVCLCILCEVAKRHLHTSHTSACFLQEDTEEKVEEKKRQLYEEDIDAILARAEVSC